jgi:hypothetical protein
MKILRFLLLFSWGAALPALAQPAEFRADVARLSSAGGQVTLTAAVAYEKAPGAFGWSISLPAGWKLVAVGGPHVPAVAPEAGSTGQLDFAYTSVPGGRAEFSLVVSYPGGTEAGRLAAEVLIRRDGKLITLTPADISLPR